VCDAAAGGVPASRWFLTRGRETTGCKQSKILGNGARYELGHDRIASRKGAGYDGAIDGNGGRRGTDARHVASRAAHFYDTFASLMWRHGVFLTPISPADTTTINELNLLFVARVLAMVSYTEGNVKILRSLLRLDSPMLNKIYGPIGWSEGCSM
jgi:hypothetical protein